MNYIESLTGIGIMVIEKNKNILDHVSNVFKNSNFKIHFAKNREEALEMLKTNPCEIIIMEVKSPGFDDYEVIKYVKDFSTDSCVIVTSGYRTLSEALNTLKAGAYDFIPVSFDEETIKIILNKAVERQSLYKERDHFLKLSMVDSLTEVFNQRHFHNILSIEFRRSHRFNHPLSLIMVDIDNFKSVNDSHGHLIGDKVLKEFAQSLVQNVRSIDYVCRYGGDEFTIILPETTKEGAYNLAKRLKFSVMKNKYHISSKLDISISLSMGVSAFPEDVKSDDQLLKKSDEALYDAKKLGKNRICLFSSETQTIQNQQIKNPDISIL
ncbi:MAG: diguanylate cyclase [Candidatus Firestonebacteria bacterium]|nr:diguanylate cyclase [Candidatus Firestonebacteria bacterium]